MKLSIPTVMAIFAISTISNFVSAAPATIEWFEPEHYRDVKPSNGSKSAFQKRVFKELDIHFIKLAESLPADHLLQIKVTNLDLAGDVKYMVGPSNSTIRVIDNLYIPRIEFSYQLLDGEKNIVQSGEENIKDMGFNVGVNTFKSESYSYEKKLIADWFHKTFPERK